MIAETSFKPLNKEPKMFAYAVSGKNPNMGFFSKENIKSFVDKSIAAAHSDGINDIQILSCAPEGYSLLEKNLIDGDYIYKGKKINFTTCRKFKGLEADKVILVDVDIASLRDKNKLFYVGSSRVRLELDIFALLNEEDCSNILKLWKRTVKHNDPKGSLIKAMRCRPVSSSLS